MTLNFFKYQGAGNDFIMVDDRDKNFPISTKFINNLCDRRLGIGADGLILLQNHPDYDFEMVYFNADGNPSSMCGNGGRCLVAFAKDMGIGDNNYHYNFIAVDGPHKAFFKGDLISLQMIDVDEISPRATAWVLNTGSPHFVQFIQGIDSLNVVKLAKAIRHNAEFDSKGINVNFVETDEAKPGNIRLRTYERGVEDETLACGTGVVASSLAYFNQYGPNKDIASHNHINVGAAGGTLEVDFDYAPGNKYTNVWLTGPAVKVFEGTVKL
jgi:diaminopimelate epimerase